MLKSLYEYFRRTVYGCGVGDDCGSAVRRKVGGAGLFGSVFCVPSGVVVVVSSGVGCRRLRVGRPGVLSSPEAIVPDEVARVFDSLSSRLFTRWNSDELITYSSRSGNLAAKARAAARRSAGAG